MVLAFVHAGRTCFGFSNGMRKNKVLPSKLTESSFVCGELNVSKMISNYTSANAGRFPKFLCCHKLANVVSFLCAAAKQTSSMCGHLLDNIC